MASSIPPPASAAATDSKRTEASGAASTPLKFNDRVAGWITKRSDVATHVSLRDEELKKRYSGGGVIFYKTGSELHDLCKQLDKKKLHVFLYQWENEKSDPAKKQIILALESLTTGSPYSDASNGGRSVSVSTTSIGSVPGASGEDLSTSASRHHASSSARSTPVSMPVQGGKPAPSVWSKTEALEKAEPPRTSQTWPASVVEAAWGKAESNPWGGSSGNSSTSSVAQPPLHPVMNSQLNKRVLSEASSSSSNAWGPGSRTANTAVWSSETSRVLNPTVPRESTWGAPGKVLTANLAHWNKYFSPYFESRFDGSDPQTPKLLSMGRIGRFCNFSETGINQLMAYIQEGTKRFLREPSWSRKRMEQFLDMAWVRAMEQSKVFFFVDSAETGEFSLDSIGLSSIPILRKHGITREFVVFDSGLTSETYGALYCVLVTQKTMMQLTSASTPSLTPRSTNGGTFWTQQPTEGSNGPPPFTLLPTGILPGGHPVMKALFEWDKLKSTLRMLGGSEDFLHARNIRADFLPQGQIPPLFTCDEVDCETEELLEESLSLLVSTGVVDADELATQESRSSLDLDVAENVGYLEGKFRRGHAGKISTTNLLDDAIQESLRFAKNNIASVPVLHYYCAVNAEDGSFSGRLNWAIPLVLLPHQQQGDGEVKLALSLEMSIEERTLRVAAIISVEQVYISARVLGVPQAAWLLGSLAGASVEPNLTNASSVYRPKRSSFLDNSSGGEGFGASRG